MKTHRPRALGPRAPRSPQAQPLEDQGAHEGAARRSQSIPAPLPLIAEDEGGFLDDALWTGRLLAGVVLGVTDAILMVPEVVEGTALLIQDLFAIADLEETIERLMPYEEFLGLAWQLADRVVEHAWDAARRRAEELEASQVIQAVLAAGDLILDYAREHPLELGRRLGFWLAKGRLMKAISKGNRLLRATLGAARLRVLLDDALALGGEAGREHLIASLEAIVELEVLPELDAALEQDIQQWLEEALLPQRLEAGAYAEPRR